MIKSSEWDALVWRKSVRSNPSGNCVEFAEPAADQVAVRNSRDPQGTVLTCSRAEFAAFVAGAKAGDFDDLLN